MHPITKGRYTARLAQTPDDLFRAHRLRHLCFIINRGLVTNATDADSFDDHCQHIMIEERQSQTLVCCFRLMGFASGADIAACYSAQFYQLDRLSTIPGPVAELGRFCIHPDHFDPDILRLAWGALTRIVDAAAIEMLFGCTSFEGADPTRHHEALALLKDAHLAPAHWRPDAKSAHIYPFAQTLHALQSNPQRAFITMPALLRTYLAMGGWVSDHAVIDQTLNTLHVFTALEINAIPPGRARLLRSLAT